MDIVKDFFNIFFKGSIRGRGHPVKNLAHYLGLKYETTSYTNPDDWFKKDKM